MFFQYGFESSPCTNQRTCKLIKKFKAHANITFISLYRRRYQIIQTCTQANNKAQFHYESITG
jgi:hypothetical protein